MADTTLASLLQRIAELKNKKDEAQHILNCLKTDLKDAEETASELLLAEVKKLLQQQEPFWSRLLALFIFAVVPFALGMMAGAVR